MDRNAFLFKEVPGTDDLVLVRICAPRADQLKRSQLDSKFRLGIRILFGSSRWLAREERLYTVRKIEAALGLRDSTRFVMASRVGPNAVAAR